MKRINFTKMVASGNDFIIAEIKNQKSKIKNLNTFAKGICSRKYGVGADGLLILEKSKVADVKMRIFNPDGSEAEMCGNGARCAALFSSQFTIHSSRLNIETKAGIISAKVKGDDVKIKLTDPEGIKLNIPITVNGRKWRANFINTGVPHVVIFAGEIDLIDVVGLGRKVRYSKVFAPKGTNVNFVQATNRELIIEDGVIEIRTYERGVEDETLACGTGAVASALITAYDLGLRVNKINVRTKSNEILSVYFERIGDKFTNVWLEGKAKIVYTGVHDV